jgi:hypothetical protein
VETLIRAVDCLRALRADEVTDPALIAIAQMSVELDGIYFPINRKSRHKEPQHWMSELMRQGISREVLGSLQRNLTEQMQETIRAKKAAACLYYVSGIEMEEIERAMGRFGGAFDGAAGPIRSVTGRTCDVLPMIAHAAEVLHAGIDLQERVARLLLRLDLGIEGAAVDLARYTERALDRVDYRRLSRAGLTARDALASADDRTLMPLLGDDRRKIAVVREALERWHTARPVTAPSALPAYRQ